MRLRKITYAVLFAATITLMAASAFRTDPFACSHSPSGVERIFSQRGTVLPLLRCFTFLFFDLFDNIPVIPPKANAKTESYKSATLVVDGIFEKKARTSKNSDISAIKKQPEIFIYLLSQEFLATLLSFLILFQVTYIYFAYMRKSKKKVKHHKRGPVNVKLNKPEKEKAKKPDGKDKVEGAKEVTEEISLIDKPDPEEEKRKAKIKAKADLLKEAKELKPECIKHAQRINHLLEKI